MRSVSRLLAGASLLVGVFCLAGPLAPTAEQRATAEDKWKADIEKLEAKDQEEEHSADSILFLGSSSIRMWDTIAEDMYPYPVIRRGYGGSKFRDVSVFAERLIWPHRFRAVVIFVGNDVKGEEGDATPEEVAGWFEYIVGVAKLVEPKAPVFCLEVFPCESRWAAWPKIQKSNAALAEACARLDGVYFIPQANGYLGPDGKPIPELYREDRLHMSPMGYRMWSGVIKSHLDGVLGREDGGR